MNVGTKRICKYMFETVQRMFLYGLAAIVIFTVYLGVVSSKGGGPKEWLMTLPLYFLTFGALIEMIMTLSYVPLLSNGILAMGATRRELSIGVIFGYSLLPLEMSICGTITFEIFPDVIDVKVYQYFMLAFGITLIVGAFGVVVGMLVDKFGRVAYYISIAILSLGGGVVGGVSSVFLQRMAKGELVIEIGTLFMWLLPIGVALYIVGAVCYWLGCRKKTVWV